MKTTNGMLAFVVILASINTADASDPTGVYALIHRAEITSAGTAEERLVIWGVFCTAVGRRKYNSPIHGFLSYKLKNGKEAVCRKEWADFKRVAGTNQCVAFGSRHRPIGRIRGMGEGPFGPVEYPLNIGVRKVRLGGEYMPLNALANYARPTGPAGYVALPPGNIRLSVAKVPLGDKSTRYYFEIRDARGMVEKSGPITPGDERAAWVPKMQLERGGRYTWRAWVLSKGGKKGPVAIEQFRGARGR